MVSAKAFYRDRHAAGSVAEQVKGYVDDEIDWIDLAEYYGCEVVPGLMESLNSSIEIARSVLKERKNGKQD